MIKLTKEEFKDMVLSYYNEKGLNNIDFSFIKVDAVIHYIDLEHTYIDRNDDYKLKITSKEVTREKSFLYPFIARKDIFDIKKSNNYNKQFEVLNFNIGNVDFGTTDNYSLKEFKEKLSIVIPKDFVIIDNFILQDIANFYNYDTFYIDTYNDEKNLKWIIDITAYEEKDLVRVNR